MEQGDPYLYYLPFPYSLTFLLYVVPPQAQTHFQGCTPTEKTIMNDKQTLTILPRANYCTKRDIY